MQQIQNYMNYQQKIGSGNTTKRVASPVNGDYGLDNQVGMSQHQQRNTQMNYFSGNGQNNFKGTQNHFNQTTYKGGFT